MVKDYECIYFAKVSKFLHPILSRMLHLLLLSRRILLMITCT